VVGVDSSDGGLDRQAAEGKALCLLERLWKRRSKAAKQCNTANNVLQVFSYVGLKWARRATRQAV
jgi:hypothetical protein